jgi:hypothetical protein
MTEEEIKARLQYLKKCVIDENISYGEIAELRSLAKYIDKGDTQLLEWAGVPEFPPDKEEILNRIIEMIEDNRVVGNDIKTVADINELLNENNLLEK